jgi:uncharacterized metal-binding protein YceD (DUF177 family)
MESDFFKLRMEADLKSMSFKMDSFILLELDKMKEQIHKISKDVVSNFDFEKEIKSHFEIVSRQRIHEMLRVECGQAVSRFLQDFEVKISIERKQLDKSPSPI